MSEKIVLRTKKVFCEQQVNGNFIVIKIPAATLNKLLGKFFKDVCKQNGSEYEPDSISSFQKSIQRHPKELKLLLNILQDEEFRRPREVEERVEVRVMRARNCAGATWSFKMIQKQAKMF